MRLSIKEMHSHENQKNHLSCGGIGICRNGAHQFCPVHCAPGADRLLGGVEIFRSVKNPVGGYSHQYRYSVFTRLGSSYLIIIGGLPDSTPGGFGRMTLKQFCNRFELNPDTALSRLEKANIRVTGDQTIKQIASENKTIPMEIYEIINLGYALDSSSHKM